LRDQDADRRGQSVGDREPLASLGGPHGHVQVDEQNESVVGLEQGVGEGLGVIDEGQPAAAVVVDDKGGEQIPELGDVLEERFDEAAVSQGGASPAGGLPGGRQASRSFACSCSRSADLAFGGCRTNIGSGIIDGGRSRESDEHHGRCVAALKEVAKPLLRACPNNRCGTGFQPVETPAGCRCHTILG
jgi:hypothetical protein